MSLTEPTFFHYFSFYKISLIITVIYQSISPKFPKFMLLFEYQSKTQCPQFFVFNFKKKHVFYTDCVFVY